MDEKHEMYDLVVVGAGFNGLSMAKTYLQINPYASVAILDEGSSVGGVWSKERCYPGLKANNWFGSYEFSDFPMANVIPEYSGPILGPTVNQYLNAYCQEFDLNRHIQLQCHVESIEQVGDYGWLLHIQSRMHDGVHLERNILAAKLVIASGTTSEALMPSFEGQEDFNAPLFHSKDFGAQAGLQKTASSVVVQSASKSAFDVAYAFATSGVQVDWIIRPSGHGPNWMVRPRVTPLKLYTGHLMSTRIITWLSPCIWSHRSGFRWFRDFFNHSTWGQKIVRGFFNAMSAGVMKDNGYDTHPELKKLKPWHDVFWVGTTRGLLNYDTDFFQLVKDGKIRVHVAEIDRLSDHTVHLSDGTDLRADAMICCAGWKIVPPMKFTHKGQNIAADLGLPHAVSAEKASSPLLDKQLEAIDSEIFTRFPILRKQPTTAQYARPLPQLVGADAGGKQIQKGYELYRLMVPPAYIHARNIAFVGFCRSTYTTNIAQAQALWITAYFNNELLLDLNSQDEKVKRAAEQQVTYDTLLHSRFGKWRFPCGWGSHFPDFFFDGLSLVDLMFHDLGLKVHRKANWFREMFECYGPKDYIGFVEEWLATRKASAF